MLVPTISSILKEIMLYNVLFSPAPLYNNTLTEPFTTAMLGTKAQRKLG